MADQRLVQRFAGLDPNDRRGAFDRPRQAGRLARSQRTPLDSVVERATATKRFGDLVQRFALAQRISPSIAQTMLRSRMLATVQRGDEPEVEQMLESLEALVRALETSNR